MHAGIVATHRPPCFVSSMGHHWGKQSAQRLGHGSHRGLRSAPPRGVGSITVQTILHGHAECRTERVVTEVEDGQMRAAKLI